MHYRNHTICSILAGWILLCGWLFTGEVLRAQETRSVMLAWEANAEPDIAGYRVYYGTTSGEYTLSSNVGNQTAATIANLSPSETYYFVITAYNGAAAESSFSNEAVANAVAAAPPVVGGTYSGAAIADANALIDLSVTKKGRFTGRLILGTSVYPLQGQFDPGGSVTLQILDGNGTPWTITLGIGTDGVSITATLTNGTETVDVTLLSKAYSKTNPAPQKGKYTALLSDANSPSTLPEGSGFGVLTVSKAGGVRMSGRLPDGRPFAATSSLVQDGSFSIYAAPYGKKKGSLIGTVTLRETAGTSDGDGIVYWTKLPNELAKYYPEGLNGGLSVAVSRFQKTSLSKDAVRTTEAESSQATLTGGDLGESIQKDITFPSGNTVLVLNPAADKLALKVDAASGLVRGSFTHPILGRKSAISGVLFQKAGIGGGYFKGNGTTGRFELIDIPKTAAE